MDAKAKAEADFVSETVKRSMPSLTRPRLKTEAEDRLADIERKNAECYAGMETFTRQLTQIANDLNEDTGGVPEDVFGDEENSLVISTNEMQALAPAKR